MSYVFLDLETTGLDAKKSHITEVGAVRTNDYGETVAEFHAMVRLPKGEKVPELIVELTGITDELLAKEGRAVGDVMNDLYEFIGDSIVVAQYAPFDLSFIEKHFTIAHFFDTRTMAYEIGHKKAGLAKLAESYGIEMSVHHRAIGDAQTCRDIFFKMVEVLESAGFAAGSLMNVVGTRPERVPSVFPKNTVAIVDYEKKKESE